ncbi:hypothetical protein [Streptosporangium roseum]|uniref:hypothetical protein n=1 Tax=Streptosporangium roseum TaxID=2001 RepID=UPI000A662653|nr:hypothetical protein [Streptosporangium roseum]
MTDTPTETNGHRPNWTPDLTTIPEQARPADADTAEDGPRAEVVSIDSARDRRHPYPPTAPAETGPTADAPTGGPVLEGEVVRVDAPGEVDRDWLADLAVKAKDRRPIVPLWLRSRSEALSTLKWVGAHYAYVAGYQATRTPKYAAKLAARSPRGAARLIRGAVRWTFDLEGEPVRLAVVEKADPESYLKLSRQRDARVRLRVWVAGIALVTLLIAGILAATAVTAVQWGALALALALLGILGAPADRPLIDRTVIPTAREKLSSDIVIRALGSLGNAAINQAIAKNPREGIKFVSSHPSPATAPAGAPMWTCPTASPCRR